MARLRERAIDAALDVVPGDFVERVAYVAAPLARHSGRTRAGAAALRSALRALAQAPRRRAASDASYSLDEIAAIAGRSTQEVERWAALGLLGDPQEDGSWGRPAVERAALITHVERHGTSEEAVIQAAQQGTLPLLLLERVVSGQQRMSAREAAKRAGVPLEVAVAIWRALGFPTDDLDEQAFTRLEVESLRVISALQSVFTLDDLIEAGSVTGRALAEMSAAFVELFHRRLTAPFLEAGASELEVSLRLAATSELLLQPLMPTLEAGLRRHLEAATRAEAALSLERTPGLASGERELSVAFADLVGFTSVSEALTPLEVGHLVARMLRIAEATLTRHDARLVKSIGDAVMFTAADPITCCRAAIDLIDEAGRDGILPPMRGGVAHGPVMRAYADYFGRTVNIASRLCDAAGPGEVLLFVPPETIHQDDWHESGLELKPRRLDLKGVSERLPVARVQQHDRAAAPV